MANIHIDRISEPRIKLREIDTRTVEFQEMKDSIREVGLLQPILVRPFDYGYEVVDGLYRFTCCRILRMETIPCLIIELTDKQVYVIQIQANAVGMETNPLDYARHIWRIIKEEEEMSVGELAAALKKSPAWINRMLNITRLAPEVEAAVRRGEVTISSAHELAKIPAQVQLELLSEAVVCSSRDFTTIVRVYVKKFKEAIKTGRMEDYYKSVFEPVPHLRPLKVLRQELKTYEQGASLMDSSKAETPLDGWRSCMDWVLQLDPDSLKRIKLRLENRETKVAVNRELRKLDRQKLKKELL